MAVEKVVNINVKDNADKTAENFSHLNEEIKQTEKVTKDTSKASEELGKTTDNITGGMVGKFKGLLSSIKTVTSSFGLLKTAIIGTGLGALLILIVSIKQAFTASEDGQNKYAKLIGMIGAVIGNILDILADLGEKLIWIFTHPKQAILDFVKLVKENIINRFNGLLELIPQLGKAINALFSGNFKEAGKIAGNAVAKVTLGVENMTDKINAATAATKKFIDEQNREMKLAGNVADMRAKADKIDRKLLVERARLEGDIAELKLKSRDIDNYTAKERLTFLQDAQSLEDKLLKKEQEALELRYESQKLENTFSRTNKENADKEAEAEAALLNIKTRRLDQQRSTLREINRTNKEIRAEEKARLAEEKRINDEKIKADKEAKDKLYKEEQERLKAEQELQDKQYDLLQELRNSKFEQEIYQLTKQYEAKFELAMGNAELEKALEEKQKQDINEIRERYRQEELAKQKAVDDKKKEDDAKRIAEEKAVLDKKYKMTYDTINALSGLNDLFNAKNEKDARTQFKINKALSLAQASIQTFQAVTGALTAGGNPIKLATGAQFIEAGIAAAVGGANIAKIAATQFGGFGDRSTSTSNVSTSSIDSSIKQLSTPNFNVVGASGISQTENLAPVKAYVVSGDVTSAQALDRNRIQNATF